jgi:hypothetical protein
MNLDLINIDSKLSSSLLYKLPIYNIRIIFRSTAKIRIVELSKILASDGFSTVLTHSFFVHTLVAEIKCKEPLNFDDYQNLIGKLSMLSSKYYVNFIAAGGFD